MIAAWIAYGLALSGILWVAAVLAERAARWVGVPTRWVWAAAIALGWTLPFFSRLSGSPVRGTGATPAEGPAPAIREASGLAEPFLAIPGHLLASLADTWTRLASAASVADLPLLLLWLCASGLLLSSLAFTYRRLRMRAFGWPLSDVEGHRVRVSEDLGPAVLGVGRGQVVLPRWAVECAPDHRRLIVLHEAEHLKAGDERLLAGAVIAVALMPWNLFAWWQLRRLRLAVELDCDRRVLSAGVPIREYASLLLEAGSRRGTSAVTAAVFVHFHSQLGRRIREMTEKRKGPQYLPAALATLGALALVVAACEAPVPTDPANVEQVIAGKQVSDVDPEDAAGLHRILEEEEGVTLVIEEIDGDTYVVDAGKLAELRDKGHAELLLRKLKEHGEVKLTLVHEDGSESASFGKPLEHREAASNELVEYQLHPEAANELQFGAGEERSMSKPRTKAETAQIKQLKADGLVERQAEGDDSR